jgi:hypothetical protein
MEGNRHSPDIFLEVVSKTTNALVMIASLRLRMGTVLHTVCVVFPRYMASIYSCSCLVT